METGQQGKGRDWRRELAGFIAETDRALDLLAGFMPEIRALDDSETLTYLHGTVERVLTQTKNLSMWLIFLGFLGRIEWCRRNGTDLAEATS